ncbi:hypothetical protein [Amycolatopsis sp. NPDC000740]|uniref:hypothetical protein n=1 Tax=Amycolatopsis sp. NPDC000740 TaxID=3154269 RepID=UPI00332CC510
MRGRGGAGLDPAGAAPGAHHKTPPVAANQSAPASPSSSAARAAACVGVQAALPGENGLTRCMRRLSGPSIQTRATCSDDPELAKALGALRTALCRFPDKTTVAFHEGLTLAQVEPGARKDMTGRVETDTWRTRTGLSGRYVAGVGPKLGLLIYQADGIPVVGTVMDTSPSHTSRRPQDLVQYFQQTVQPGE